MDVNIKVCSDYLVPAEEEQVAGNNDAGNGRNLEKVLLRDCCGRGPMSFPASDLNIGDANRSTRLLNNEDHVVRLPSCSELSFNEAHYAEARNEFEDEKPFKSLELDRSDVQNFFNEQLHHSVDDMVASWSQSRSTPKSRFRMTQSATRTDDDDDEEDDDLETVKNKIKSVWNNATNG